MSWLDQISLFLSVPADQLLAITAYGEAGQEGGEGMMAVLNVIRNRTLSLGRFGDSDILNITKSPYHAVILKKAQFSIYNPGDKARPIAERIARDFDEEVSSNNNLRMAYDLSVMLLNDQLADNTGGADHYHAAYVTPSWASQFTMTTQIGNHMFYASGSNIITAIVEPVQEAVSEVTSKVSESISSMLSSVVPIEPKDVTMMLLIGLGVGTLVWGMKKQGVFKGAII